MRGGGGATKRGHRWEQKQVFVHASIMSTRVALNSCRESHLGSRFVHPVVDEIATESCGVRPGRRPYGPWSAAGRNPFGGRTPIVIDCVKAKTVQSAPDDGVPLGVAEAPTDRAMELGPSEAHGTNRDQGALNQNSPHPSRRKKHRCLASHETI